MISIPIADGAAKTNRKIKWVEQERTVVMMGENIDEHMECAR